MITLDDCEAFCDADPASVEALARAEHLPMSCAIAMAHSRCADDSGPRLADAANVRALPQLRLAA